MGQYMGKGQLFLSVVSIGSNPPTPANTAAMTVSVCVHLNLITHTSNAL
jgi:hypothetical protein